MTTTNATLASIADDMLALLTERQAATPEPETMTEYITTPQDFAHLSLSELKGMAKHLGLSTQGSKLRIAERLADYENEEANAPAPAPDEKEALKAWLEAHQYDTHYQFHGDCANIEYDDDKYNKWLERNDIHSALIKAPKKSTPKSEPTPKSKAPKKSTPKSEPKSKPTKSEPTPKSEPKSEPTKSEPTTDTLTYRQAQRFISWCKANVGSFAPSVKNVGWDNVLLLTKEVKSNTHFKVIIKNKEVVKELLQHLECSIESLRYYLTEHTN